MVHACRDSLFSPSIRPYLTCGGSFVWWSDSKANACVRIWCCVQCGECFCTSLGDERGKREGGLMCPRRGPSLFVLELAVF